MAGVRIQKRISCSAGISGLVLFAMVRLLALTEQNL